jgi:hypothetical protein
MNASTLTKFTLVLHGDAWQAVRRVYYEEREVIGYRVGGLPAGESARISELTEVGSEDWRIMRIKDNVTAKWVGNYQGPEEAVAWLQGEVDKEQRN